MLKYNNTHIFTGYLKQLLSSFNLPACKVYTHEFAKYLEQHNGEEDPRVLESFDTIATKVDVDENGKEAYIVSKLASRVNYLKNNELYHYFRPNTSLTRNDSFWKQSSEVFYNTDKFVPGLTRSLNSPGSQYDTITHEYLGDYLRFLRDYYNVNLMSMYNCFNDKLYNNVYFTFALNPDAPIANQILVTFTTQDPSYRIYAVPVKLFSEYTIAVDCAQGIEMFCGLYNTSIDGSEKAKKLAAKTYTKFGKTLFNQPVLYDKLNVTNWPTSNDFIAATSGRQSLNQIRTDVFTRWDITNREKDLKLFIKVPTSCKSSITILEGDYRGFNDSRYLPLPVRYNQDGTLFDFKSSDVSARAPNTVSVCGYQQNHSVLNLAHTDLNNYNFKPISKLQLLALNTGESYPFADRLIEYLSGSAITSIDEIPDNISRVQKVMEQNKNYFNIEGVWEDKMQNILYGYMINSKASKTVNICANESCTDNFGKEIAKETDESIDANKCSKCSKYDVCKVKAKELAENAGNEYIADTTLLARVVKHSSGSRPRLGYTSQSTLYDVLGYVDKDTEKWYSSWKVENGKVVVKNNIQNVDIYNGLYNIE